MPGDPDDGTSRYPWRAYDNLADWAGERWVLPSWFRDDHRERLIRFGDYLVGVLLPFMAYLATRRGLDPCDGQAALSLVFSDDFERPKPIELISERSTVKFFKFRSRNAESHLNRCEARRPVDPLPEGPGELHAKSDSSDDNLADHSEVLRVCAAAQRVTGNDGRILRLYLWAVYTRAGDPIYEAIRELDPTLGAFPDGTLRSHQARGLKELRRILIEEPPEIDALRAFGRTESVAEYARELLFPNNGGV